MIKKRDFIIAVAISLILHLFGFWLLYVLPEFTGTRENAGAMEVFLQQPDGGWRIADIPEPGVQEKPDKSNFLGMYNQKVREESVSPTREWKKGAKDEGKSKGEGRTREETDRSKVNSKRSKADKAQDLFAMKMPYEKMKKAPATEVESGAPTGSHAEMPEDFYPDYKFGAHTYLNVLRYPEVEYFVRLKRIFKMTWDPVTALRRDIQGNSVAQGAVSVVLAVSVNKEGSLDELFVLRSSGMGNYDQEALRTVRASSPFAAPPTKFLEKDGLLRMSWTFVVYM